MSMHHDDQAHEIANTLRAIIAEANVAQMPADARARIIALAEFAATSADDLTDAIEAALPVYPDIMAEHLAATHPNVVRFPRKGV